MPSIVDMVLETQGHCCLVFECLGRSLYDYLKKNDYRGFPMNVLRPIARELLQVSPGWCTICGLLLQARLRGAFHRVHSRACWTKS